MSSRSTDAARNSSPAIGYQIALFVLMAAALAVLAFVAASLVLIA